MLRPAMGITDQNPEARTHRKSLLQTIREQWRRRCNRFRGNRAGERDLSPLFRQIGILPERPELYRLAMTHRSKSITNDRGERQNNERLEFLGDAILDAVCSKHLYLKYPLWDEGELSKCKGSMVSRPVNNEVGRRLHLERYIIAIPGALEHSADLYGNTVEALIGAIYLDQGFLQTEQFVCRHVLPVFYDMEHRTAPSIQNYKSELIEWTQKHHLQFEFVLDEHLLLPEERFTYTVWINGKPIGSGSGSSKKRAQQQASYQTLALLREAQQSVARRTHRG